MTLSVREMKAVGRTKGEMFLARRDCLERWLCRCLCGYAMLLPFGAPLVIGPCVPELTPEVRFLLTIDDPDWDV